LIADAVAELDRPEEIGKVFAGFTFRGWVAYA